MGAPERPVRSCATLLPCGNVMTGRGVDQILLHPSNPPLFEPYVLSARTYVELAEKADGRIARPVSCAYIWANAIDKIACQQPDARMINLESAVTTSADAWQKKGIHYRMQPANVACLTSAGVNCCALAKNQVLDWGYRGLAETIAVLQRAGIKTAGAGAPTVVDRCACVSCASNVPARPTSIGCSQTEIVRGACSARPLPIAAAGALPLGVAGTNPHVQMQRAGMPTSVADRHPSIDCVQTPVRSILMHAERSYRTGQVAGRSGHTSPSVPHTAVWHRPARTPRT